VVTDGTTAFSNVGATTDGPFEGERCDDLEIGADIWFTYTATCTGMAIVSLCGSEYDTTLAVYNGSACPTRPRAIQCSDDDCRDLESRIIVPVVQGQTYLVRVGGYDDETGTGVLSIRCTVDGSNDDVCKPGGNECGLSHRTPGCTDVETCESMCDNDPSCCDVTWHGRCGCPLDEMSCDGTCISTTTDNANCGTCGNVCAAGTTCLNGTCSVPLSCPPPLLHCGTCVDPLNDGRNCGACFVACATNEYCSGGTCVPSEPCGPECEPSSCPGVDLWWDSANCGTCGNVCPPKTACAWGTCEGICIDCE